MFDYILLAESDCVHDTVEVVNGVGSGVYNN